MGSFRLSSFWWINAMAADETVNHSFIAGLIQKKAWPDLVRLVEQGRWPVNEVITDKTVVFNSPLLPVAIERGAVELALLLIQRGADVNRATYGASPLIRACESGQRPIVEALLAAGAKVNDKAPKEEGGGGETPLMLVAEKQDHVLVQKLLQAGADSKTLSARKYSAAFYATSAKEKPETLAILGDLVAAGAPLTGEELHSPAYRRELESVRLLIKLGCPVNTVFRFGEEYGPKKGSTPLTVAVAFNANDLGAPELGIESTEKNCLPLVKSLLQAGADPNQPDGKGLSPLHHAVQRKDLALAEILVGAGGDPHHSVAPAKESAARMAGRLKLATFQALFGPAVS